MDDVVASFLEEHVRRFNEAVASGDSTRSSSSSRRMRSFTSSASPPGRSSAGMRSRRPTASSRPDDQLDVLSAREEDDVVVERFAWRRGGTGTMRVTVSGGRIARLVVASRRATAAASKRSFARPALGHARRVVAREAGAADGGLGGMRVAHCIPSTER